MEAMKRFELRSFIELTRRMELEETVRRRIIEDVVKTDNQLRLVYQMMEQEEQQKEEQQALKRKEESWEKKRAQEKKSRIEGKGDQRRGGVIGNMKEKKGGK